MKRATFPSAGNVVRECFQQEELLVFLQACMAAERRKPEEQRAAVTVVARRPRNTECMERFWRWTNRFANSFRPMRVAVARLLLCRLAEGWNRRRMRDAWAGSGREPSEELLQEHPWLAPRTTWTCRGDDGDDPGAAQPLGEVERGRLQRLGKVWAALSSELKPSYKARSSAGMHLSPERWKELLCEGLASAARAGPNFVDGATRTARRLRGQEPGEDGTARQVAYLFFPKAACSLCESTKLKMKDEKERRVQVHADRGPFSCQMLLVVCEGCKAELHHDVAHLARKAGRVSALRSLERRVVSTSAETVIDAGLVKSTLALFVRGGLTLIEAVKVYIAGMRGVELASQDHTLKDLQSALVSFTLGRWLPPGKAAVHFGNHGDDMEKNLAKVREQWVPQYWEEWVVSHATWCSPECAEIVAIDADLKITALQCAAEVRKERIGDTTFEVPVFCGAYTRKASRMCCTNAACTAQREDLRKRVAEARGKATKAYDKARAMQASQEMDAVDEEAPSAPAEQQGEAAPSRSADAAGVPAEQQGEAAPSADATGGLPCYTGGKSKRDLMLRRRRLGSLGVLGAAFTKCQTFTGFQQVFVCESHMQCIRFLAELVHRNPMLKHVLYDNWCQTAAVLRSRTSAAAAETRSVERPPTASMPVAARLLELAGAIDRCHAPKHARPACHTQFSANAHSWCFEEYKIQVDSVDALENWRAHPHAPRDVTSLFLHSGEVVDGVAGDPVHLECQADPPAMVWRRALEYFAKTDGASAMLRATHASQAEPIQVAGLELKALQRIAVNALTNNKPDLLSKACCARLVKLKAGTRISSIIVQNPSRPQDSERAFHFFKEQDVIEALRHQPFPLKLRLWRPRDTQALERSWRRLNRCQRSLHLMRPELQWFMLHLIADAQNRSPVCQSQERRGVSVFTL